MKILISHSPKIKKADVIFVKNITVSTWRLAENPRCHLESWDGHFLTKQLTDNRSINNENNPESRRTKD